MLESLSSNRTQVQNKQNIDTKIIIITIIISSSRSRSRSNSSSRVAAVVVVFFINIIINLLFCCQLGRCSGIPLFFTDL